MPEPVTRAIATRLEEDERIVTGTLQGAKECKTGLANHFDNVDDALDYLRFIAEQVT